MDILPLYASVEKIIVFKYFFLGLNSLKIANFCIFQIFLSMNEDGFLNLWVKKLIPLADVNVVTEEQF